MNAPETLPTLPLSRQAERTLAEQLAAHYAEPNPRPLPAREPAAMGHACRCPSAPPP